MLKAPAVAAMLGLSARAVYDLADRGILACYRLGAGRGAVRFQRVAPELPGSRLFGQILPHT